MTVEGRNASFNLTTLIAWGNSCGDSSSDYFHFPRHSTNTHFNVFDALINGFCLPCQVESFFSIRKMFESHAMPLVFVWQLPMTFFNDGTEVAIAIVIICSVCQLFKFIGNHAVIIASLIFLSDAILMKFWKPAKFWTPQNFEPPLNKNHHKFSTSISSSIKL